MKLIAIVALILCLDESSSKKGHIISHLIPARREENINPRIINGQPAQPSELPYMAGLSLYDNGNNMYFCGGALISKVWIITAAHCLIGIQIATVFLGSIQRRTGPVQRNATSDAMVIHPEYNHVTHNNDIALINILAVRYSVGISPIRLPRIGFNLFIGSIVTAAGWGATSTHSDEFSPNLMHTQLQVITNERCRLFYDNPTIDEGKLCTSNYRNGAICHGDSGGPLVLGSPVVLVGIASFCYPQGCLAGPPDGFTRITFYLNWIRNKTGVTA